MILWERGGVNFKLSLLFVTTNHFFSAVCLDLVLSDKRLSPNSNCRYDDFVGGGGGWGRSVIFQIICFLIAKTIT